MATIASLLDYYNAVFAHLLASILPDSSLHSKMQLRPHHFMLLLSILQWITINHRVKSKVHNLAFHASHVVTQHYLSNLICHHFSIAISYFHIPEHWLQFPVSGLWLTIHWSLWLGCPSPWIHLETSSLPWKVRAYLNCAVFPNSFPSAFLQPFFPAIVVLCWYILYLSHVLWLFVHVHVSYLCVMST